MEFKEGAWPHEHVEALLKAYLQHPLLYKTDPHLRLPPAGKQRELEKVRAKLVKYRPDITVDEIKHKYHSLKCGYSWYKRKWDAEGLREDDEIYKQSGRYYYFKYFVEMEKNDPVDKGSLDESVAPASADEKRPNSFSEKMLEGMMLATQVLASLRPRNGTESESDFARCAGDLFTLSLRKFDFSTQLRAVNHMTALVNELILEKSSS